MQTCSILLLTLVGLTDAFVSNFLSTALSAARTPGSFIPNLPGFNPEPTFSNDEESDLVAAAQRFVLSDFGLQDTEQLAESFECITALDVLDREEYLTAGRFFDLRRAIPDLQYRPYDFRQISDTTVRLTTRSTGTLRGALRLRDQTLPPNGQTLVCPPEGVSVSFDNSGKVVKIIRDVVLDRLVGTTEGTTGVLAAAVTAGEAVSDWQIYPPLTVLGRVFARPGTPLQEPKTFLAPFPATVMIQLAKGMVSSKLGSLDESLVSDDDFSYISPLTGPIRKRNFLKNVAPLEFEGISDIQASNYRVDPYDPERVWVDVQPVGPGYEGAPQAWSFRFDIDGYCTRVTTGAVLDESVGNGGGLPGVQGVRYARGARASWLQTTPVPKWIGYFKKSLTDPVKRAMKKAPELEPQVAQQPPPAPTKPPTQPPPASSFDDIKSSLASINIEAPKLPTPPKEAPPKPKEPSGPSPFDQLQDSLSSIKLDFPKLSPPKANVKPASDTAARRQKEAARKADQLKQLKEAEVEKRKQRQEAEAVAARRSKEDQVARAVKQRAADAQAKKEAQIKAKEQAAMNKELAQAKAAREREAKAQREAQEKERRAKEAAKAKEAAAFARAKQVEAAQKDKQKRAAEKEQAKQKLEEEKQERASLAKLASVASSTTISLLGFGKADKEDADFGRKMAAQAPSGVPTLTRWRKNTDGSLSGYITGARNFEDGERVTTSIISKGEFANGQVVTTRTGSRYFLGGATPKATAKASSNERKALANLSNSAPGATIRLWLGDSSDDNTPKSSTRSASKLAPRGVPTLRRWKKNSDGSVTGQIFGSKQFDDGERITSSPLKTGTVASGEVVGTSSGSRYFLS